ncbi:hypothetical protein SLEP1_g12749 [Rubroshorea leprosula]|uniref:Uncharacterized protein n=1 Tax=Rubroshorea leprosula TaxID=152421 RepID=A0AAV5II07_9ROSI|nr:hypothetical protein SLEP1_g12749 [Rubroshorea leprosula]
MNPSSWELFGINYGVMAWLAWMDEHCPSGEARHLHQQSLALAMLLDFARKRLGGKDMEMNLIPKIVQFDANRRLKILPETNQRCCLGHHQPLVAILNARVAIQVAWPWKLL